MKKMKSELLFGFFLLILGLQGKAQGEVQTFNDESKLDISVSHKIDWMDQLEDSLPISAITLPGTHDTMALHGGPAAKCQAWTLEDQLKAGIRYLDLRVFALLNKSYLVHGIIYQQATFPEVLETVKKFLMENPRETVLVRVKPEFIFKSKVEDLVKTAIAGAKVWVKSEMPTVGEVRGHIVFVQKKRFTLGIKLTETDANGDYKVVNIDDKTEVIQTNLDKCVEGSACLTYSSGTGMASIRGIFELLTPKKVAETINPWLYVHLKDCSTKPYGIIAMDFPGLDLIQRVINCNQGKFIPKKT